MTDNTISNPKKTVSILGQTLSFPGIGALVVMTTALAGVMLLVGMLGLGVSIPGFVFGCGVMWLTMAGLDLRQPKAWALLMVWGLIVFGLELAVRAII